MSREVRQVSADWQHPKDERTGRYQPMHNKPYSEARAEWLDGLKQWQDGTHEDFAKHGAKYDYWEWDGAPPEREYYMPEWSDEQRTHVQLYETVSEGTPISPVFATREELARWYCDNGDPVHGRGMTYEQCLSFVNAGWAPSFVGAPGRGLVGGPQAVAEMKETR